jgi:hypothetical protein
MINGIVYQANRPSLAADAKTPTGAIA